MLFAWIRNRANAAGAAKHDAAALIFSKGKDAHDEAKRRERASILKGRDKKEQHRSRNHWRRVARIIAENAT